jgi:hypothetical protein
MVLLALERTLVKTLCMLMLDLGRR